MSHAVLAVFTVAIYVIWTISAVALIASVVTVLRRVRRTGKRVAVSRSVVLARTATEQGWSGRDRRPYDARYESR